MHKGSNHFRTLRQAVPCRVNCSRTLNPSGCSTPPMRRSSCARTSRRSFTTTRRKSRSNLGASSPVLEATAASRSDASRPRRSWRSRRIAGLSSGPPLRRADFRGGNGPSRGPSRCPPRTRCSAPGRVRSSNAPEGAGASPGRSGEAPLYSGSRPMKLGRCRRVIVRPPGRAERPSGRGPRRGGRPSRRRPRRGARRRRARPGRVWRR